jgi:hypothetical protein
MLTTFAPATAAYDQGNDIDLQLAAVMMQCAISLQSNTP